MSKKGVVVYGELFLWRSRCCVGNGSFVWVVVICLEGYF